ncbi:phosphatase [Proteinivorax hydrogeniformans]|uniref:Phosphatase n=1 Tax=Proteinivorax hydrogeniformans TaxID=1826727 RepID=A0AAU8HV36_9FIRM
MKFKMDLHTHTISSGHAYSTLMEMVKAASDKGLEVIAITDHGPAMPGGPHPYYFGNMRTVPAEMFGVEVLRGVECNIIDELGNVDLIERFRKHLDIIIGGFHTDCFNGGDMDHNTDVAIKAMEKGVFDILVHPGNPEFPIDSDKIVKAAKENNVLIEINNSSLKDDGSRKGSLENCYKIAKSIAKHNWKVSLGSDAHISTDVGVFSKAAKLISDAGIKEEQIINTDVDKFKEFLAQKNRTRYTKDTPEV